MTRSARTPTLRLPYRQHVHCSCGHHSAHSVPERALARAVAHNAMGERSNGRGQIVVHPAAVYNPIACPWCNPWLAAAADGDQT